MPLIFYRSHDSPVFTCFLDASKCFDKINHGILFSKMIKRGIPPLLVRVLIYWYTTQTFCVKWGSVTSSYFNVTNGVRQGGILSPYLFTLYVNDLSEILCNVPCGLHVHNVLINHLFYADEFMCHDIQSIWSTNFIGHMSFFFIILFIS